MNKKDRSTIIGLSRDINKTPNQFHTRDIGLVRTTLSVYMLVITVVLSACSSSTSNLTQVSTLPVASVPQSTRIPTTAIVPTATIVPQKAATPTTAIVPPATSVPQPAVTTQLDPCQLISRQEASTLAGASLGNGVEGTTPGGLKICTYGYQTTNVFTVDVVQAPDVNTAQADKAQFLADIQANLQNLTNQGLNITELPSFADGATMADASVSNGTISVNGRAFGFLKGTIFFGFSDVVVGGAAPSSAAVQSEATTVLGKLP